MSGIQEFLRPMFAEMRGLRDIVNGLNETIAQGKRQEAETEAIRKERDNLFYSLIMDIKNSRQATQTDMEASPKKKKKIEFSNIVPSEVDKQISDLVATHLRDGAVHDILTSIPEKDLKDILEKHFGTELEEEDLQIKLTAAKECVSSVFFFNIFNCLYRHNTDLMKESQTQYAKLEIYI